MERRLESHIEVTVFRNVQELLQNAMNHAQATQIQIQLDMGQDQVTAVVEDNGSGFNVDDTSAAIPKQLVWPRSEKEQRCSVAN